MYPYEKKKYQYADALDLKHPETKPVAAEHNTKQSKFFCVTANNKKGKAIPNSLIAFFFN